MSLEVKNKSINTLIENDVYIGKVIAKLEVQNSDNPDNRITYSKDDDNYLYVTVSSTGTVALTEEGVNHIRDDAAGITDLTFKVKATDSETDEELSEELVVPVIRVINETPEIIAEKTFKIYTGNVVEKFVAWQCTTKYPTEFTLLSQTINIDGDDYSIFDIFEIRYPYTGKLFVTNSGVDILKKATDNDINLINVGIQLRDLACSKVLQHQVSIELDSSSSLQKVPSNSILQNIALSLGDIYGDKISEITFRNEFLSDNQKLLFEKFLENFNDAPGSFEFIQKYFGTPDVGINSYDDVNNMYEYLALAQKSSMYYLGDVLSKFASKGNSSYKLIQERSSQHSDYSSVFSDGITSSKSLEDTYGIKYYIDNRFYRTSTILTYVINNTLKDLADDIGDISKNIMDYINNFIKDKWQPNHEKLMKAKNVLWYNLWEDARYDKDGNEDSSYLCFDTRVSAVEDLSSTNATKIAANRADIDDLLDNTLKDWSIEDSWNFDNTQLLHKDSVIVKVKDDHTEATFGSSDLKTIYLKNDSISLSLNDKTFGDSSATFKADTFQGTATKAEYADLAEIYRVNTNLEPGLLMSISCDYDSDDEMSLFIPGISREVDGVISYKPGIILNANEEINGLPIALSGRVHVQIDNETIENIMFEKIKFIKGMKLYSSKTEAGKTSLINVSGHYIGKVISNEIIEIPYKNYKIKTLLIKYN